MKREQVFVTAWSILLCFALWKLTSYEPKIAVTCKVEKCVCDTGELVKVRKELKKKSSDLYWIVKQRDSLRIECHEKDGIIGDTNVFKRMYFDNEGKLIQAK